MDLQALLNKEPRMARVELAKHVQKIVLKPQRETYIAVGDWNLFGVVSFGGAGGPDCTVRAVSFCLPVAA